VKKRVTYAELKSKLDTMTAEQLARPVIWIGDERGGYVNQVYEHAEDMVGESSDPDTWVPRSEVGTSVSAEDYVDAEVCVAKGTVELVVD
jgi:hypothetical protein